MKAWRIGVLLFLLGSGLGWILRGAMAVASAQSDNVVRLLRSIDSRLERIDSRLERINRNTDDLSRNFDKVRDWDVIRVRPVK